MGISLTGIHVRLADTSLEVFFGESLQGFIYCTSSPDISQVDTNTLHFKLALCNCVTDFGSTVSGEVWLTIRDRRYGQNMLPRFLVFIAITIRDDKVTLFSRPQTHGNKHNCTARRTTGNIPVIELEQQTPPSAILVASCRLLANALRTALCQHQEFIAFMTNCNRGEWLTINKISLV